MNFGARTQQILPVPFVGTLASIGAAIFMIDQAHRVDRVDLYRQLNVLEDHLIIMYATCQGNNIEIIIAKADRDPRLEKLLQAVIHAVDDQRVAVNSRLVFRHSLFYRTSPSSRFKN